MKHSDEFDNILGDSLAEYREAEPLAGLEDRVLRRLRLQSECRRKLIWRWGGLTASAAMLVIAFWMGLSLRAHHQPAAGAIAYEASPVIKKQYGTSVSAVDHHETQNSRPASKEARSRQPHGFASPQLVGLKAEPMREQFPAPTSLTPNEQTLLALAQTDPAALQDLPDDATDAEIAIAPITIKPLAENLSGPAGDN